MLASVTMCKDDIRNYNSKISDLGPLTLLQSTIYTEWSKKVSPYWILINRIKTCQWSRYFMHDLMQVHGVREGVYPSPAKYGSVVSFHNGAPGRTPATSAYFGVRKILLERKCHFFTRCKAKNWHFHMETMHLGACIAQTARTNHWHLRQYGWSNPSYDVKRADCGSWLCVMWYKTHLYRLPSKAFYGSFETFPQSTN